MSLRLGEKRHTLPYVDEDAREASCAPSEDEDAIKEAHVEKVVSTNPFDLPHDIVLKIFKTGASLRLA